MMALLNYIVEANLCLIIFLIIYVLWLQNETDFTFNRFYILSTLCFSAIFPLIQFDAASGSELIPSLGNAIQTFLLPEVVIYGSNEALPKTSIGFTIWNMLIWIYFLGVFVFSLLFLFRLGRIILLIKNLKTYYWNNCKVAQTNKNLPTFSFFNFILIGQADTLTEQELQEILRHENVHVKSFHTADILLLNIIEILFWFNPAIRIYKKILIQIHEFQADARAVENHDLSVYCDLLARVALQSADFSIANHFNKSLTLKRITMMQTVKSKIKLWKLAAIGLAIPFTFFFIACQDQVMEDVSQVIEGSTMAVEYPVEVQQELDKLKIANPNSNFNVVLMDENGLQKLDDLEKIWNPTG